jgi:hypothetical protein
MSNAGLAAEQKKPNLLMCANLKKEGLVNYLRRFD